MIYMFAAPKFKNQKEALKTISISLILLLTIFNTFMILEGDELFEKEVGYEEIMPKGEPEVYGATMGINYQDISQTNPQQTEETIEKLSEHDRNTDIEELNQQELRQYISIGTEISCEYCCEAPSIIQKNGEKACVCEHSYAMRGLAKYLITEHDEQYTEEEILEELGKWKTRFFPDQHMQKAEILQNKGIETNYINLTSNEYRGIEQNQEKQNSGMVGDC